jgi:hypothetical protein
MFLCWRWNKSIGLGARIFYTIAAGIFNIIYLLKALFTHDFRLDNPQDVPLRDQLGGKCSKHKCK